jgi:hypothetical protein
MPIDLKYSLSLDDYLAGQYFHAQSSVWLYLNYVTARFVFPVVGALIFAESLYRTITKGFQGFNPFQYLIGIFLISFPLYYRHRLKRCYIRTRTDGNECSATFHEDLIHAESTNSSSDLKWAAVQRYSENDKCFLVYLAPSRFMVLPKRVFQPGQADEFRALLQRKIS